MAEYIQEVTLDFTVETNKKTIRICREVDTIDHAIELLQELKADMSDGS